MKKDGNSGKQDRLAQALRANLRRRKLRTDDRKPDDRPDSGPPEKDSTIGN